MLLFPQLLCPLHGKRCQSTCRIIKLLILYGIHACYPFTIRRKVSLDKELAQNKTPAGAGVLF